MQAEHPKDPAEKFRAVPTWMKAAKRWLLYQMVKREGGKKPSKVPYYVNGRRRGKTDSATDVQALASFEQALAALRMAQSRYAGLGFALGPDGTGQHFQGIDLDDLASRPHLEEEIDLLPGYVERSPSGNGAHAIGYGQRFAALGSDGSGLEAYCEGRFFTVTGDAINSGAATDLSQTVESLKRFRKADAGPSAGAAAGATAGAAGAKSRSAGPDVHWDSAWEMTEERAREVASALCYWDPDSREEWVAACHALKGADEPGWEIFRHWSSQSYKHTDAEARTLWDGARPQKTGLGAIFARAQKRGWVNPRSGRAAGSTWRDTGEAANDAEFRFRSARELTTSLGPVSYLVDGLIEDDSLAMLFGESGVGKSFLALDWACCVATGTPWLGRPVKPGPVFVIAGEGQGGMARRLAAWQKFHGISLEDAPLYVSETAAALMTPDSAAAVSAAVEKLAAGVAPQLVIVDTLNRNLGPGDENSALDVAAFLAHVDEFIRKKFGSTVLVVHHSGHQERGRARGSSALGAAMDAVYSLKREDSVLELTCHKQKDGEEAPPCHLALKSVDLTFEGGSDDVMTSLVLVSAEKPRTGPKELNSDAALAFGSALEEAGEVVPTEVHAGNVRGVRIAAWRTEYMKLQAGAQTKQESQLKQFRREKQALENGGIILTSGEWAWPANASDFEL